MAEIRPDQLGRVSIHVLQIAYHMAHLFEALHEDGVGLPVAAEEVGVDAFELFANFSGRHFHHGARDPLGIRPLVLGELDGCYILASETCALDIIGAQFVREVENGEAVVISDDGRGMDADTARRAFDPFFSGREAGRGIGLGLPKALRLVESSGGSVSVDSRQGRGTRVTVALPAADTPG